MAVRRSSVNWFVLLQESFQVPLPDYYSLHTTSWRRRRHQKTGDIKEVSQDILERGITTGAVNRILRLSTPNLDVRLHSCMNCAPELSWNLSLSAEYSLQLEYLTS